MGALYNGTVFGVPSAAAIAASSVRRQNDTLPVLRAGCGGVCRVASVAGGRRPASTIPHSPSVRLSVCVQIPTSDPSTPLSPTLYKFIFLLIVFLVFIWLVRLSLHARQVHTLWHAIRQESVRTRGGIQEDKRAWACDGGKDLGGSAALGMCVC